MAPRYEKPEDIKSKKARAMFFATAEVFYGGDLQAALDALNKHVAELERIDKREALKRAKTNDPAEMILRFSDHQ